MKSLLDKLQSIPFVMKYKQAILTITALIVLLCIYSLFQMFSGYGHNSYVGSGYSDHRYEITEESYAQNDSFGFAPKMAALTSVSRSADISPGYPVIPSPDFDREAEYDDEVDRKIIKNGSLNLVVTDLPVAVDQIKLETERLDGFVSHSNISENSHVRHRQNQQRNYRTGYITMRVPSDNFDAALSSFKKLALKVENESTNSNDVTEEFADLETQIINKQAEEAQYRSILARATKISDVLEVTRYLNETRTQIERMQGQLNRLSNQVSLSTITINLTAEEDVELFGVVWSPLDEIKQAFSQLVDGLVGFVNTLIGFVFIIPVLVLYALLYGAIAFIGFHILRKIWQKIRNK